MGYSRQSSESRQVQRRMMTRCAERRVSSETISMGRTVLPVAFDGPVDGNVAHIEVGTGEKGTGEEREESPHQGKPRGPGAQVGQGPDCFKEFKPPSGSRDMGISSGYYGFLCFILESNRSINIIALFAVIHQSFYFTELKNITGKITMKRVHVLIGGIVFFMTFLMYIAVRLAMRDAGNAADFVFKVFGAFMALLIASVGPFGMIGLAILQRHRIRFSSFAIFITAGLLSLLLVAYVLIELDIFSLIR